MILLKGSRGIWLLKAETIESVEIEADTSVITTATQQIVVETQSNWQALSQLYPQLDMSQFISQTNAQPAF